MGWALLLFVLSALPDVPGPSRIPYGDKLGHFLLYGVLGALLAFGRLRSPVPHLLLLAVGALYGVTDEMHQAFVPGRSPDVADWVADLVGLVTGYALILAVREPNRPANEPEEAA